MLKCTKQMPTKTAATVKHQVAYKQQRGGAQGHLAGQGPEEPMACPLVTKGLPLQYALVPGNAHMSPQNLDRSNHEHALVRSHAQMFPQFQEGSV